jgi:hypothetical protein
MADPRAPTRNQLARWCNNDPELIRLIERLFLVAGTVTPGEIATLAAELNARIDAVEVIAAGAAGAASAAQVTADEALALAEYLETLIGAANTGDGVLSFGPAPGGNVATLVVTGQADIVAASVIRAWVQGDTPDHNAYEHTLILPGQIGIGIGDVIDGVGFTIYGQTELRLTGDVAVKWEWS